TIHSARRRDMGAIRIALKTVACSCSQNLQLGHLSYVRGAHVMSVYTFNTFDDPSASTGTTHAIGLNDTDQIVGYYHDATGRHGYLLSGGTYTTLDDPLATSQTQALAINNSGQIVGDYVNNSGRHGFLLSGGTYTTLDVPGATGFTVAEGINATGQIVGSY